MMSPVCTVLVLSMLNVKPILWSAFTGSQNEENEHFAISKEES